MYPRAILFLSSAWALLAAGRRIYTQSRHDLDLTPGWSMHAPRAEPRNASQTSDKCAKLAGILNRTTELFTRRLTREEYYARNFMWIRCRTKATNYFDMGGAWMGRDGQDIRLRFFDVPMTAWVFRYVRGNWGDATLFFDEFIELPQHKIWELFLALADLASERYKRNFYIIDCQNFEGHPFYATERKSMPWFNEKMVKPSHGNRAYYNAAESNKLVGFPIWEWPKRNPKLIGKTPDFPVPEVEPTEGLTAVRAYNPGAGEQFRPPKRGKHG